MAINKNSNVYIITYTVVMVVIVGALLATLATWLKPTQDANVLNEQKVSIMKAFGEADANFDEVVTMGRVAGGKFTTIDKSNTQDVQAVFDLLGNRKELGEAKDNLPIFKFEKDGASKYVLPIVGKGLWGDIWGYVSLYVVDGKLKISGIVMDHAGETPGLGAEIATPGVQGAFVDKVLYDANGEFAVRMQKGGAQNEHQVDAITGGTKTCDGVNDMLEISITKYKSFLDTLTAAVAEDTTAAEDAATVEEQPAAEENNNVEPENKEE